jgi:hypothetical protein
MDSPRTSREVREQIAYYRSLRRMTVDKRTLEALAQLTAEAEEHLRRLEKSDQAGSLT